MQLGGDLKGLEITWSQQSAGVAENRSFRDPGKAQARLTQFLADPKAMSQFRWLLRSAFSGGAVNMGDEQVLAQIVRLLSSGQLRIGAKVRDADSPSQSGPAANQAPTGESSFTGTRGSDSSVDAEQEEALFPADADLLAVADGQRRAAEQGTPFCEECARAAAASGRG